MIYESLCFTYSLFHIKCSRQY